MITDPPAEDAPDRLGGRVRAGVRLAGIVGRAGFHVLRERATPPHPTTLREVPPGVDALTARWLTLALCDGVSGAEVTGFRFGAANDGTSSRRTMTVEHTRPP